MKMSLSSIRRVEVAIFVGMCVTPLILTLLCYSAGMLPMTDPLILYIWFGIPALVGVILSGVFHVYRFFFFKQSCLKCENQQVWREQIETQGVGGLGEEKCGPIFQSMWTRRRCMIKPSTDIYEGYGGIMCPEFVRKA